MKRPYIPKFADKKRIEAADYRYACPECICDACKCAYWHHRTIKGFDWLVVLCDGTFVKL